MQFWWRTPPDCSRSKRVANLLMTNYVISNIQRNIFWRMAPRLFLERRSKVENAWANFWWLDEANIPGWIFFAKPLAAHVGLRLASGLQASKVHFAMGTVRVTRMLSLSPYDRSAVLHILYKYLVRQVLLIFHYISISTHIIFYMEFLHQESSAFPSMRIAYAIPTRFWFRWNMCNCASFASQPHLWIRYKIWFYYWSNVVLEHLFIICPTSDAHSKWVWSVRYVHFWIDCVGWPIRERNERWRKKTFGEKETLKKGFKIFFSHTLSHSMAKSAPQSDAMKSTKKKKQNVNTQKRLSNTSGIYSLGIGRCSSK